MADSALSAARFVRVIATCSAVAIAAMLIFPWIGSTSISAQRVFAHETPDYEILVLTRLSRVLLAMLAGGALASAGVLFQALLRDSLADPYTLGISSGTSLGAVLAICLGWRESTFGVPAIWFAALTGAAGALALVMWLASFGRRVSSFSLLMSGVTVNTIAIAVILLLQNIASFSQSFAINRWLMGSIESVEFSTIGALAMIVLPLILFLSFGARNWNLIAAGQEWAAARGLPTTKFLWTGFLAGSLLTGSVTVITGPVGFLGLIVPHALRLWLGADHRLLLPASFLVGGAFLALSDTVARTILAPAEIPVGVITAMTGGPFFLWLLRTRQRRW